MTRFSSSFPFTIVVSLVVGACASPPPAPEPTPQASEPVSVVPAKPKRSKAAEALDKLPPVTMLSPERAMRDGMPTPRDPAPERLVGLTGVDIHKMLGIPDFKRRDLPAQIWQYRRDGCMLDVFLYQENDAYVVRHVEARGHTIAEISETDCLLEALAR